MYCIIFSVPLKCGIEHKRTTSVDRINIITIKLKVRITYHLIFHRKHGLDAEKLASALSFPHFGKVVLLLLKSTL